MSWVLDASAALAWAFDRADANERRHSTELLNRLSAEGAIVPDFWNLEVVNALLVAQRRSVMSTARCRDFLARLGALPILAQAAPSDATHRIFDLSGQFGLTAYDASYLDLALRTGSPLATFDRRLADACGKAGVVLA